MSGNRSRRRTQNSKIATLGTKKHKTTRGEPRPRPPEKFEDRAAGPKDPKQPEPPASLAEPQSAVDQRQQQVERQLDGNGPQAAVESAGAEAIEKGRLVALGAGHLRQPPQRKDRGVNLA